MYFLTALVMTLISACLYFFVKTKKNLHFGVLAIAFGSATLMWLIDCIVSAFEGEGFLSFEIPLDIWISLWTIAGGLLFYGIVLLVFFIQGKIKAKKEKEQVQQ